MPADHRAAKLRSHTLLDNGTEKSSTNLLSACCRGRAVCCRGVLPQASPDRPQPAGRMPDGKPHEFASATDLMALCPGQSLPKLL